MDRARARTTAFGALLLAATALAAAAKPAVPPGFERRPPRAVERVVDGDTLVLAGGERVRLLGIDTPEMDHPSAVVRALARSAKDALDRLVSDRAVVLLVGTPATDSYGRTLAYVHVTGTADALGPDVGEAMVAGGFAQLYPVAHPRLERYRAKAAAARRAGRGLWSVEGETALGLSGLPEVAAAEAGGHVGERVRVTGRVTGARRTAAGLFVDLGESRDLAVVVFGRQLELFPTRVEDAWRGRSLAVSGTVRTWKGRPEIVVEDPSQVAVVGR